MDYELSLVPASQSVEAGATTSFDVYFTNNTQNDVTVMGLAITSSGDLVPENAAEEDGVIYGEATIETYNENIIGQCALTINDAEYGNYFSITLEQAENSNAVISTGKIATVTITLANNVESPLDLEFGVDGGGYTSYGYVVADTNVELTEENTTVTNASITVEEHEQTTADIINSMRVNIGNAYTVIAERDGTVPANKNLENLADAIDSIPAGSGGVRADEDDDVLFIDYDGSIVCSYSVEDFLELIEMPANPTHEGLVSQGWNWSLADAKTYVTNHGMIDIGQMYGTTSGASEFDIELTKATGKEVSLQFDTYTTATIDWGDNTIPESIDSSTMTHTYTDYGEYTIKVSGDYTFGTNCLITGDVGTDGDNYGVFKNIRVANGITSLPMLFAGDGRNRCVTLKTITLPSSLINLGAGCFYSCQGLECIIIPNSVSEISVDMEGNYFGCIMNAYAGTQLKYFCIPNGITKIGEFTFGGLNNLKRLCLPDSVTAIYNGQGDTATHLWELKKISLSNGITDLHQSGENKELFTELNSLKKLIIPNNITISSSVSYINDFSEMKVCEEIIFGNNVGAWNGSGSTDLYSVKKIKFGSAFSTMPTYHPFESSYSCEIYDFSDCLQIPTLTEDSIACTPNTKIIVPDSLYSSWIVATYWVSYADYIYRASEV